MSKVIFPDSHLIAKLWEKFTDSQEQYLFPFLQSRYPKANVDELFPVFTFMCNKYRDKLFFPENKQENYHQIGNLNILKVQKK